MTETERQEWNAAVASGDAELIEALADRHLVRVARKIMSDDPNYRKAGYTP